MTYASKITISTKLRAIESVGGMFMGGDVMGGSLVVIPQTAGMAKRIFELGDTVGIEAKCYDEDGALFTPSGGYLQIRIEGPRQRPGDTPILDWTNMDPRGIGIFLYQHQIALTDLRGTYIVRVRALLSSGKYKMETIRLYVEAVA